MITMQCFHCYKYIIFRSDLPLGVCLDCYLNCPKKEDKMKKIPFNLERALAGDLCIDDNGTEYKFMHHSPRNVNQKLLFVENFGTIHECSHWCNENGLSQFSLMQLHMKPKKKTYWANIYKDSRQNPYVGHVSESEAEIKNRSFDGVIKTISFEVEE